MSSSEINDFITTVALSEIAILRGDEDGSLTERQVLMIAEWQNVLGPEIVADTLEALADRVSAERTVPEMIAFWYTQVGQ